MGRLKDRMSLYDAPQKVIEQGLYPFFRVIESEQDTVVTIEGLSEALRMELKPFMIRVVVVNPGDFRTSNTSNRMNIVEEGGPYEEQFKKSLAQVEKDETGGWDPQILARKLVKIVEKRKPRNRYVVGSFDSKLAVFLKKFLAVGMFSNIMGSHYGIK
jgi:short-subunit dehydrogenase